MNGVSVISCTNRPQYMQALMDNYARQQHHDKELIIIINKDHVSLTDYIRAAHALPQVRIYRQPDHVSLGRCLNYGVSLAQYPIIAKFDDDDYYAPHYLSESIRTMRKKQADIVGKRAHYMYLHSKKMLLLRYYNKEHRCVPLVQGATLLIRRSVFGDVEFPDRNNGECVAFCTACKAKGYKIYAGSKFNFIAHRRKHSQDHTWIVTDRQFRKGNVKVIKTRDMYRFVQRR